MAIPARLVQVLWRWADSNHALPEHHHAGAHGTNKSLPDLKPSERPVCDGQDLNTSDSSLPAVHSTSTAFFNELNSHSAQPRKWPFLPGSEDRKDPLQSRHAV